MLIPLLLVFSKDYSVKIEKYKAELDELDWESRTSVLQEIFDNFCVSHDSAWLLLGSNLSFFIIFSVWNSHKPNRRVCLDGK